jgi:hypothetical protein
MAFNEQVLDLLQRISKHRPDRFAKSSVGAGDLAKLGNFFADLAQLRRIRAQEDGTEVKAAGPSRVKERIYGPPLRSQEAFPGDRRLGQRHLRP